MKVGLLSPGHMGSAIGRRLREQGAEVVTCVTGRSERSQGLAREAGLRTVPDLVTLVGTSDVILSIVTPSSSAALAAEISDAVREVGQDVVVADCNAVAPDTTRRIGEVLAAGGATFVDGSIIGAPPVGDKVPRLFVSGPDTSMLEGLTAFGLDVRTVSSTIGAASALKMSFAAATKGTAALSTLLLVAAARNDVAGPLMDELRLRRPGFFELAEGALPQMPMRSRRWVGEMEEIDAAFAAAGLPAGTFAGIAELYRWVGEHPLAEETPETLPERTLEQVIALLAAER